MMVVELLSFAWAVAWRVAFIFAVYGIVEHQLHVWILHSKKLIRFSYRQHHVEHHGQGRLDLRPHIDLGIPDLIFPAGFALFALWRAIYVTPYAWIGVVTISIMAFAHQYFWSRLHRAIHRKYDCLFRPVDLMSASYVDRGPRLEESWVCRRPWFRAFELHHLKHHANPRRNLSVVFLWTDWIFGTLYDREPFWKGGGPRKGIASRRGE